MRDAFGPRKLDVFAALTEAYRGVWKNFGEMLQLIWLPGLIYLALSTAPAIFDLSPHPLLMTLVLLAGNLLWPIIAVAWHRFILVGDTAERSFQIRYGRRELRFLLASIALTMLFFPGLVMVAITAALTGQGTAPASFNMSLLSFLGLIFLLIGIYFFIRLSLLLPAVSVDAPLNIPLALERTRGNFWRLFSLFMLTGLPVIIAFRLVDLLLGQGGMMSVVGHVIDVIILVFFGVLGVAILSIAYRELIETADSSH